jgi:hypothetical protein
MFAFDFLLARRCAMIPVYSFGDYLIDPEQKQELLKAFRATKAALKKTSLAALVCAGLPLGLYCASGSVVLGLGSWIYLSMLFRRLCRTERVRAWLERQDRDIAPAYEYMRRRSAGATQDPR